MPTNSSAKKARPSKGFPLTNEVMLLYTMLDLQEDLKHDWDEIAEKLGIKVGAARKRWERTRNSIIERTKKPEAQASEQAPAEDEE
ncbi:uncharacterized protein N7503_005665 [Penicillium pulvis]|uniref:uncharacterized protein n=1 Tax=Penicillium pulvis TaxID=1562058 RepID=UPI002547178A|nr:uncharacterized protein N7503_005665 [Penicillium pulvis]KAJ5803215.1 hypothetical protein N7503_005665 [Penicillium pulvis]